MSDQKKNTTHYSAGDIQKYLGGEMSPAEMHALEKAALEDPFLADAIEGMGSDRSLPTGTDLQKDLAELHSRLADKIAENKKKAKPGIWMRLPPFVRVAAVLILLVGLGGITFYSLFNRSMDKSSIARMEHLSRKESRADTSSTTGAGSTVPAEADHGAKNEPEMDSAVAANVPARAKKSRRPESDKQASPSAGQASNASQGAAVSSSTASPGKIDSMSIAARYDSIDPRLAGAPTQQALEGKVSGLTIIKGRRAEEPLFIAGKIVDEKEQPLAGVSVYLEKDRTKGVSTDSNGYFRIRLRRQDSLQKLNAFYIGYEPAAFAFNPKSHSNPVIRMEPSRTALNEVVVIGYGAAKRKVVRQEKESFDKYDRQSTFKDSDAETAIPVIGWPAYELYLKNNKPLLKVDTSIKGNEVISFKVNSKGELSSFKADQSLSPAHDSSVIRLIQQGPAWKLSNGKKTSFATVILTF